MFWYSLSCKYVIIMLVNLILYSVLVVVVSCQKVITGGEELQSPRQIYSSDGLLNVELNVTVGDVLIVGDVTKLKEIHYNGRIPGPTLRVKPGDAVTVVLRNLLEGNENKRNATNLYFHGLHSPTVIADEFEHQPFFVVMPGNIQTYMIKIDEQQSAGTYTYYSKMFGLRQSQFSNGMTGLIIVEENACADPLLDIISCPQNCQDEYELIFLPSLFNFFENPNYYDRSKDDNVNYFTVNGQFQPIIKTEQGQLKRLRLVNAGNLDTLEIDTPCNLEGDCCAVHLVGADGVYFREPRSTRNQQTLLAPGQRAEWILICEKSGEFPVTSNPLESNNPTLGTKNRYSGLLTTIVVEPRTFSKTPSKLPITISKNPKFVDDRLYLSDENIQNKLVIDVNLFAFSNLPTEDGINSKIVSIRQSIVVDTIQEWTLFNSDPYEMHTIQFPVNHVQITSYNKYKGPINIHIEGHSQYVSLNLSQKCGVQFPGYNDSQLDLDSFKMPVDILNNIDQYERYKKNIGALGMANIGEWKDVVSVPPLSNITVRFVSNNFTVNFLLHSTRSYENIPTVSFLLNIQQEGVDSSLDDSMQYQVMDMGKCITDDYYPKSPISNKNDNTLFGMSVVANRLAGIFRQHAWYEEYISSFVDSYFGPAN